MKKVLMVIVSIIASAILSVGVYADMGPKPQITINVLNAPDEVYYLDLLQNYSVEGSYSAFSEVREEDYNADMLALLRSYEDEGWYPALLDGTSTPMWGSLVADENGQHIFGYFGTPDEYRIIIVTESGKVVVSDTHIRTILQENVTFDFEAGTIVSDNLQNIDSSIGGFFVNPLMQIIRFLVVAILITVIVEGLMLLAFRYKLKKNLIRTVIVNLVTNLCLNIVILFISPMYFIFAFALIEVVVFAIEAFIYSRILIGHKRGRAVLYALAANAASCLVGCVILYFIRFI